MLQRESSCYYCGHGIVQECIFTGGQLSRQLQRCWRKLETPAAEETPVADHHASDAILARVVNFFDSIRSTQLWQDPKSAFTMAKIKKKGMSSWQKPITGLH